MNSNENQNNNSNLVNQNNVDVNTQPNQSNVNTNTQQNLNNEQPNVNTNTQQTKNIPSASDEKVVINTVNHKKSNNLIPILLIIAILILILSYMDKIIAFFDSDNNVSDPIKIKETDDYNLVDGYIVINDNSSYIKINKIKFYNFILDNKENSVSLNYISDQEYVDSSDLKIYIEFYNVDKQILYKEMFVEPNIVTDTVKKYKIKLDDANINIDDIKYALVKKYTKDEEDKITKLTCSYKDIKEGYNIDSKKTFNFKNNLLISYDYIKKIDIFSEDADIKDYQSELKNENDEMITLGIVPKYELNQIEYTIDLNKKYPNYVPEYKANITPIIVKNNEESKKWVCE